MGIWNASPQSKKIVENNGYSISICWDSDYHPEDPKTWFTIITFSDIENPDKHFHINLSLDETIGLKNWLEKFIKKVKSQL